MKNLKVLFGAAVVVLVAATAFVYSGWYPIGADVPHWPLTLRILESLRDRSIARQSESQSIVLGHQARHQDERDAGVEGRRMAPYATAPASI